MSNWTPSPDRPGYRRKIVRHGMATIILERPILDEAAEAKAQENTRRQLESVMRQYYGRKTKEAAATA